jgi:4-hydroxybenzoate polyprenyltransferase
MSEILPAAPNVRVWPTTGLERWWTYQRERFPLLAHGPLIAAFSASGVSFSAALRGAHGPSIVPVAAAFVSALCFFFQLRVSDEIKDATDDARFRPYRPVPRGLVTLRELRLLAALAALTQVAIAVRLDARLLLVLALVWTYMALMQAEFFAGKWLRTRPLTVLWTHMLVMPLIDLYVTSCDWLPARAPIAAGLKWFLVASFFNGLVVEIGRKMRAPADEERGVDTYTALWGRTRSVSAWLLVMTASLVCAVLAASVVGAAAWVFALLVVLWTYAAYSGLTFARSPHAGGGRRLELVAGIWTLLVYLSLGVAPWMVSHA